MECESVTFGGESAGRTIMLTLDDTVEYLLISCAMREMAEKRGCDREYRGCVLNPAVCVENRFSPEAGMTRRMEALEW